MVKNRVKIRVPTETSRRIQKHSGMKGAFEVGVEVTHPDFKVGDEVRVGPKHEHKTRILRITEGYFEDDPPLIWTVGRIAWDPRKIKKSECPNEWELLGYSKGFDEEGKVERHLTGCEDCRELLALTVKNARADAPLFQA